MRTCPHLFRGAAYKCDCIGLCARIRPDFYGEAQRRVQANQQQDAKDMGGTARIPTKQNIPHKDGSRECQPVPSGGSLPDDAGKRNEYPMADGLLDYFPNALAEVAKLSHAATKQHHPDKPMHWDRSKSKDHRNKIIRHLVDSGKLDDKGMRHSAMVAWRALALLQEELEAEGAPMSRASR